MLACIPQVSCRASSRDDHPLIVPLAPMPRAEGAAEAFTALADHIRWIRTLPAWFQDDELFHLWAVCDAVAKLADNAADAPQRRPS